MVSGNILVRIVETSLVINSHPFNTYTNDIEVNWIDLTPK